jgi:hypothetical protein
LVVAKNLVYFNRFTSTSNNINQKLLISIPFSHLLCWPQNAVLAAKRGARRKTRCSPQNAVLAAKRGARSFLSTAAEVVILARAAWQGKTRSIPARLERSVHSSYMQPALYTSASMLVSSQVCR